MNLPTIDITNLESKISFTDGVYIPPIKQPCKLYNLYIIVSNILEPILYVYYC